MSIIVSNCQHCNEQQFQNNVMCTLHTFLSSKVRFIQTSTVTGSDSVSGKNYAYASRTSCQLSNVIFVGSYYRMFLLYEFIPVFTFRVLTIL